MDRLDSRILQALQDNSRQSIAELAARIGLSISACHRRMRLLEETGVITGYGARVDPGAIGLGLHALIDITLESQSSAAMEAFEQATVRFHDILECHLLSGTADYRLRIAARDMADYDRVHRRCLAELPGVATMHTSFIIRSIKHWAGYVLQTV